MQYRKYIRTYHLPWSDSIHSDDKLISDLTPFKGKEIFVTEKMDGECTTMYRDYIHARSIDSKTNYTRSWATQMHSVLKYEIPENMRLVVENLWAEHSIR